MQFTLLTLLLVEANDQWEQKLLVIILQQKETSKSKGEGEVQDNVAPVV
jgi:hypothetical protein